MPDVSVAQHVLAEKGFESRVDTQSYGSSTLLYPALLESELCASWWSETLTSDNQPQYLAIAGLRRHP